MSAVSHDGTKEDLLLEAASEVFLEKGLSGARMQEIAARAGVNKGLLHYYFRSKENIFSRILQEVLSTFLEQIDVAIPDDMPFVDALRLFIDSFVDYIAAHPRVPLFMMQELSRGGKLVNEVIGKAFEKTDIPGKMVRIMRREMDAGRLEPVNPLHAIITVLGACLYYFLAEPILNAIIARVEPGLATSREEFVARRKEEIFTMLYYGLKKRDGHDAG
jgi:TetR/AcrR family transcriptional regulator